jgi:hypothetical protein
MALEDALSELLLSKAGTAALGAAGVAAAELATGLAGPLTTSFDCARVVTKTPTESRGATVLVGSLTGCGERTAGELAGTAVGLGTLNAASAVVADCAELGAAGSAACGGEAAAEAASSALASTPTEGSVFG